MTPPTDPSPAYVVRQLLIDLGAATAPADPPGRWPVYVGAEPPRPDEALTAYDTAPVLSGRAMATGEAMLLDGVMLRFRSPDPQDGRAKAAAVRDLLSRVYQRAVAVGSAAFLVHAFSRTGGVTPLGPDAASRRYVFTLNTVCSVRRLT